MVVSSSPVRRDVVYLRRRVKPVPAQPPVEPDAATDAVPTPVRTPIPAHTPTAAPQQPGTRSTGLDLRPGRAPEPDSAPRPDGLRQAAPVKKRPEQAEPFPAPSVSDVRELGVEAPVLRLNARESAIGSLIVTGAVCVVWESSDLVTGSASAGGAVSGTPVVTAGNRELVGFDESDAVVALRHVRELRRALFIGDGSRYLGVQLFDGSAFAVAAGDGADMFVLSLLQIGGVLELRAEPVPRTASIEAIQQDFGFTMTAQVAVRDVRRR